MSLKHYLFGLFALFVLLLAGLQLGFIHYIQQQIGQEVELKSRTLSERAVRLLVDEVAENQLKFVPTEAPEGDVRVIVENTPGKTIELGNGIAFVTGEQTKTVTIKTEDSSTDPKVVSVINQQLEERLEKINISQLDSSYSFFVGFDTSPTSHKQIVHFNQRDSVIHKYFNWLLVGTIILCSFGLIFAYWLARHISRPLGNLSQGFNKLEAGDLGTQVEPEGIQEVKLTLEKFNQMSARLAELNQLEKQFQQQQQLAELGEVARGLAHTLRNPINTIGLALEQMSQTGIDDTQRVRLASQVRQKINHLDNTIKALLSLTAGGVKRNQQINVNHVIEDIIMELSMSDSTQIHFQASQPLMLTGAMSEIRSMIHTLISNAVEASPKDKPVTLFTHKEGQQLFIKVLDEGEGIDEAIREQLFTPHVSSKPEGAGMGLYITKRICQSYYKGDVKLMDNLPTGCVATLTLTDLGEES
jgi:signal transduction histidine kinase